MSGSGEIDAARVRPGFRRFFARYAERMIRRKFHSVRMLAGGCEAIRETVEGEAPVVALLSHASWWDPLVGLLVWRRYLQDRDLWMPMDADQLARFGFFKRLGAFGVRPDDPRSLEAMRRHVLAHFRDSDRPALGLTPQGRFTDPREPVRLRPGAAAIAAAAPPGTKVMSVAVEYVFWQDQRPEILIAAGVCPRPVREDGTTAWHRAMTESFRDTTERLASAAIARDPTMFVDLHRDSARIHPLMDAWMRITGRGGGIDARRATGKATT